MIFGRATQALAKMAGGEHYQQPAQMTERELSDMLDAYYFNNDLYVNLQRYMRDAGLWAPDMKALRNPVYSAVEFYAMTVWPGTLPDAMPINAVNPKIIDAIHKVWKWSNWSTKKQWAVRSGALSGDLFLRVEGNHETGRVYVKHVPGRNVTDFRVDERGVITYLRYDAARLETGEEGTEKTVYHTEVWEPQLYRQWTHTRGYSATISSLGEPSIQESLLDMAGIDFVPWVHAPFKDIGDSRGMPLVWPCLGKIDEVNRKCTRLAQMLFVYNKAYMAVRANHVDGMGRPQPAPRFNIGGNRAEDDRLTFGDDEVLMLPGNSSVDFLIPGVNFTAHMDAIAADMGEIERDMPEITFYNISKQGAASGRALELQMGPAIQRVLETRGNFEAALVRAQQMALTLGQNLKIDGFEASAIGTYEKGDFDHSFAEREVIPLTATDRGETVETYARAGVPLGEALARYGRWTRGDVNRIIDSITSKSAEEIQAQRDAIQAEAVKQVAPIVEAAIKSIGDAAISNLVKSGAIEKLIAASVKK